MALTKIMGIENEYGLFLPEGSNPPINVAEAILAEANKELGGWCYMYHAIQSTESITSKFLGSMKETFNEALLKEAKEQALRRESTSEEELMRISGISGLRLPNGARFYIDLDHPEYSTPESSSVKEALTHDLAGEAIVERARILAEEALRIKAQIHKDNSDRHGKSFGTHENYLVEPNTFKAITQDFTKKNIQLINFFIARQLICGSGKVGSEDEMIPVWSDYQISQRADFFHSTLSEDTMKFRGIINTRNRPYADPVMFRRLHVIVGDANLCEHSSFLKLGLTSIFLKMLEDDFVTRQGSFLKYAMTNSVVALKVVSRDLTLKETLPMEGYGNVTALSMLNEVLRLAKLYHQEVVSPSDEEKEVMRLFEFFLEALENGWEKLYGYSDWVTKYMLLSDLKKKGNLNWHSDSMKRLDSKYHNLNPETGFYRRLDKAGSIKHLVTREEVNHAVQNPTNNGRAFLRGILARDFNKQIEHMGWEAIDFVMEIPGITKRRFFGGNSLEILNPLMSLDSAKKMFDEISYYLKDK